MVTVRLELRMGYGLLCEGRSNEQRRRPECGEQITFHRPILSFHFTGTIPFKYSYKQTQDCRTALNSQALDRKCLTRTKPITLSEPSTFLVPSRRRAS